MNSIVNINQIDNQFSNNYPYSNLDLALNYDLQQNPQKIIDESYISEKSVSLSQILGGFGKENKSAIDKILKNLSVNGWVLVKMLPSQQLPHKNLEKKISNFIENLRGNNNSLFELTKGMGYESNNFRDAYRWFTGNMNEIDDIPEEFCSDLFSVSSFFDNFFIKLLGDISNFSKLNKMNFVSYEDLENLGEIFEIPLLYSDKTDKLKLPNLKSRGFGMIDVVHYANKNQNLKIDRDELVESHVDPGLFSFSTYSSLEGLELYDRENNIWIQVPLDMGAIWCGYTAEVSSEGYFKGGYHRVNFNYSDIRRTTIWYEVIVESQIFRENYTGGKQNKVSLTSFNKIDNFPKLSLKNKSKDKSFMELNSNYIVLKNNDDKLNYTNSNYLNKVKNLDLNPQKKVTEHVDLTKGSTNGNPISIFVETQKDKIRFTVNNTTTIESIKRVISNKTGKSFSKSGIIRVNVSYKGNLLNGSETISSLNIKYGETLYT